MQKQPLHGRLTSGLGVPTISSIFFMTSGVSFGSTSSALRFSFSCSGFDAPRITVLVCFV